MGELAKCGWGCFGVVFLVGMILLIVSFVYVEFDEFAFRKNTTTNTVYTNDVYENGRYLWGPNWDVVTFSRLYTEVMFEGETSLDVSNSEGIQINIDVNFWYRIRQRRLGDLYDKYGVKFHAKAQSIAKAALKNTAITFTLDQYLRSRSLVSWSMNQNVSKALDEIWLEVEAYKFRLGGLKFTDKISNKFLESAIQLENNEKKEFEQQASIIREETKELVQAIESNTTIVNRAAVANKERIVEIALANAEQIRGTARGEGLSLVINNLTITSDETRHFFLKLMAILDNKQTRLVKSKSVLVSV